MPQVQATEESFLLPVLAPAWRTAVKALLIIGAIDFVIRHFNTLWSGSVDLAHHYALVAYIEGHFRAPSNVPYLAEMSFYPHYSHALAAMLGTVLGSPLMGLQLLTLLAIYGLWAAIAIALGTLPQRQAWVFLPFFAALLALNRFVLHAELFGQEVINNFFFAELVAQALCAWIFTLMLLMERRGKPALLRYMFCVAALHLAVQVHLLPTLELFGSLGLLIVLDVVAVDGRQRLRTALLGGIALILGGAVIVLDPAFAAMRRLSANNGALNLHLLPDLPALALLAIVVILLSLALTRQWFGKSRTQPDRRLLAYKYFACFGAAAAILCLLQMLLLRWGMGSEYACRKYAFALQTAVIIDLALLICAFATRHAAPQMTAIRSRSQYMVANLSPASLLGLGLVLGFAPPRGVQGQSVGHLVAVEHAISAIYTADSVTTAARQNYVAGIAGLPWIDNYLFSIGRTEAPLGRITIDFTRGLPVQNPERIGEIITSAGSRAWDVPACRQHPVSSGLVVVDGACVIAHHSECDRGYDFAEGGYLPPGVADGFNGAESSGRWSQGLHSSIRCTLKPGTPRPARVLIYAQGHLSAGPQRMLVSINGGPDHAFVYSRQNPSPVVSMDIPEVQGDKLRLDFKYPDARQASDRDLRIISVFFHRIRFE